jgi:hypothetical protein
MRLIIIFVTVVALYLISVKLLDPVSYSDQQPLQYIEKPLRVIQDQTDSVVNSINASQITLTSLLNSNSLILAKIANLTRLINNLGFNLTPLVIDPNVPDNFVSPYPDLNNYIQSQLDLIDVSLPCYPILTDLFTNLQDIENYTYNGELNTYIDSSVIPDLLSSLQNLDPYIIIQTKVFNIINTCVTIDLENVIQSEPV